MGRHEILVEHYEDALFTLLLEKCMEQEGAAYLALNESLKHAPGDTVPPGAYERGLDTIRRTHTRQQIRGAGRMARKILSRLAVAVCCVMLLFMTAFAVSPAVRKQVYTLVKEVTEVSTDFSYVVDPDFAAQGDAVTSLAGYSEPVVPDGFSLVEAREGEKDIWRMYQDNHGGYIRVELIAASPALSRSVDTEDADLLETVRINEFEGLLVEKDNIHALHLADVRRGVFLSIIGENVDSDTLRMIAEGMSYSD